MKTQEAAQQTTSSRKHPVDSPKRREYVKRIQDRSAGIVTVDGLGDQAIAFRFSARARQSPFLHCPDWF
jgi:hypothetical protein